MSGQNSIAALQSAVLPRSRVMRDTVCRSHGLGEAVLPCRDEAGHCENRQRSVQGSFCTVSRRRDFRSNFGNGSGKNGTQAHFATIAVSNVPGRLSGEQ